MGHGHNKHDKPAEPDPVHNLPQGGPPAGSIPTQESTLPPQSADLQGAHGILGRPVRAVVGGRVMTVFLVDYDVGSGTYNGIAGTVVALDVDQVGVQWRPVYGLRAYPYVERPAYSFQFVWPGQDESPIINIAQHNAVATPDQPVPDSTTSGN